VATRTPSVLTGTQFMPEPCENFSLSHSMARYLADHVSCAFLEDPITDDDDFPRHYATHILVTLYPILYVTRSRVSGQNIFDRNLFPMQCKVSHQRQPRTKSNKKIANALQPRTLARLF
jgi:hypothetical protein